MSLHFTHPDELTPEVTEACGRLADAGIPLGSQTVLLKDINDECRDDEDAVPRAADEPGAAVLPLSVRPDHRLVPLPHHASTRGLEIMQGLRGHTTGYAVPTYVIDAPGGGGKIPLLPDYVVGRDGDDLLLRNFEGKTYRYPDPGRDGWRRPGAARRASLMRVALVYDLRDDYRALGYSEEEVAEFDTSRPSTSSPARSRRWAATVDARRPRPGARGATGRRRSLRSRVLHCRRAEGAVARGASAGVVRAVRPALSVLRPADDERAASTRRWPSGSCATPACRRRSFAVAERNADDVADWADFPAFVKPLAEGTGKGCEAASLVQTRGELRDAVARVIARYGQPALVERYLPGREFTVGIVGNGTDARVLGVCEILLRADAEANVYSLHNKELCEELVIYAPADDAEARLAGTRALEAYRALECRDAARIDFRSDAKGEPYFLEANPLAGLNPWHSDLPILAAQNGIDFVALIGLIVDAGLARYGMSRQGRSSRRKSA